MPSVLRPAVWLFTAKAREYMVFLKQLIALHIAKKFPAFIMPRYSDVHNKSPLDPTINHYPIHSPIYTAYFFKTHFSIILPPVPRSPLQSLPRGIPNKNSQLFLSCPMSCHLSLIYSCQQY